MKTNNDTRISVYYRGLINGQYVGQVIGSPDHLLVFSKPGAFTRDATTPGILLSYTEVAFYLAEAAARWGIGGSPAALYSTAVTSSFSDWGKMLMLLHI